MTSILFLLISSMMAFAVTPVTSSVAQVDRHVITSREVQMSYLVQMALVEEKNIKSGILSSGPEFEKHLSQWLLEYVVYLEAENFSIAEISAEELKSKQDRVKQRLEKIATWKELSPQAAEVEAMISKKLRSKAFLKFKTESGGVQISDEEAKSYFDKNRVRFGATEFLQFKDNIKQFLAQEQQEAKLREWFEILKRKYQVRFISKPS